LRKRRVEGGGSFEVGEAFVAVSVLFVVAGLGSRAFDRAHCADGHSAACELVAQVKGRGWVRAEEPDHHVARYPKLVDMGFAENAL
jgi:hypothetical protein